MPDEAPAPLSASQLESIDELIEQLQPFMDPSFRTYTGSWCHRLIMTS